jgi:hypothetical protein
MRGILQEAKEQFRLNSSMNTDSPKYMEAQENIKQTWIEFFSTVDVPYTNAKGTIFNNIQTQDRPLTKEILSDP